MMKTNLCVAAVCCGLALFAACKKSDNNNNNNSSAKKQTLIAGKWQLTAATLTGPVNGVETTTDIYAGMDDCDKDDFSLFAANGTGTIDEAANKCDLDPQIENFTWKLLNNDTQLEITGNAPITYDIVELTGTQAKIKTTQQLNGVSYTGTQTYKNLN